MAINPEPLERQLARLRWHCRRGMRELDVLLERYLQERYPSASANEQEAFRAILELPDPVLFAYVTHRESPIEPTWIELIAKLTRIQS
jgi:antitoxin CptB